MLRTLDEAIAALDTLLFQWAPTLGGECYEVQHATIQNQPQQARFNGHPPLGVNATRGLAQYTVSDEEEVRFNGHPPLGVNAT